MEGQALPPHPIAVEMNFSHRPVVSTVLMEPNMNKKILFLLVGVAGWAVCAQAQSDDMVIYRPLFDGDVIVAGAEPTPAPPIVYNRPVVYNAPVLYRAPVAYEAPVYGDVSPYDAPAGYQAYQPDDYAGDAGSSVQVIDFGGGQAAEQGYDFGERR